MKTITLVAALSLCLASAFAQNADAEEPADRTAVPAHCGLPFSPDDERSQSGEAVAQGDPCEDNPSCKGDFNVDFGIDILDLLHVLGAYDSDCGDIDNDQTTNINDVLYILANWGSCIL